jgi:hypothetical protein
MEAQLAQDLLAGDVLLLSIKAQVALSSSLKTEDVEFILISPVEINPCVRCGKREAMKIWIVGTILTTMSIPLHHKHSTP